MPRSSYYRASYGTYDSGRSSPESYDFPCSGVTHEWKQCDRKVLYPGDFCYGHLTQSRWLKAHHISLDKLRTHYLSNLCCGLTQYNTSLCTKPVAGGHRKLSYCHLHLDHRPPSFTLPDGGAENSATLPAGSDNYEKLKEKLKGIVGIGAEPTTAPPPPPPPPFPPPPPPPPRHTTNCSSSYGGNATPSSSFNPSTDQYHDSHCRKDGPSSASYTFEPEGHSRSAKEADHSCRWKAFAEEYLCRQAKERRERAENERRRQEEEDRQRRHAEACQEKKRQEEKDREDRHRREEHPPPRTRPFETHGSSREGKCGDGHSTSSSSFHPYSDQDHDSNRPKAGASFASHNTFEPEGWPEDKIPSWEEFVPIFMCWQREEVRRFMERRERLRNEHRRRQEEEGEEQQRRWEKARQEEEKRREQEKRERGSPQARGASQAARAATSAEFIECSSWF